MYFGLYVTSRDSALVLYYNDIVQLTVATKPLASTLLIISTT